MPAWLGPVIQGIAAVGGGILGNRANREAARESMAFSERMASTQAQRAAKDYEAAGLNPALAYDRPAAAPGGSVAQQEDVIGKGISSGMAARAQRAQLDLMEQQTRQATNAADISHADKVVAQAKAAAWQMTGEGSLRDLYAKSEMARLRQEMALQPFQLQQLQALLALQQAQGGLTRAQLPGLQAEADLWKRLDKMGPVMKGIAPFLRLIRPR